MAEILLCWQFVGHGACLLAVARFLNAEGPADDCVISNFADCKYTDCVVVCHVGRFCRGRGWWLHIHPDECIDCEACVPGAGQSFTRTISLMSGKSSRR